MRSLRKAAKQRVMGSNALSNLELDFAHVNTYCSCYGSHYILPLSPNSPYDGKWSKTMVGFGAEDEHFVAELTYNYGVGEYRLGNDFLVSECYRKTGHQC